MTPKVSCLNFGVPSLFDSKSSKVKKTYQNFQGQSVVRPPLYGGKFGGQKHQKYHAPNFAYCFRMTSRGQNWKNLPKFPGVKCGQNTLNWQLLFAILLGSSYLITILFIILAGFLKCWVRGGGGCLNFKQSLLCENHFFLVIENEILKEN